MRMAEVAERRQGSGSLPATSIARGSAAFRIFMGLMFGLLLTTAPATGPGTLVGALDHFQPSAARSTVLRQRRSPVEQLHGDGECRLVSLHLLAAATVLDFVHHVAGGGPVPGRLAVMNRNAQRARGALWKVVEDVGVSTVTATAWPACAARATWRCHSTAARR
jgi:hypothetical protein